LNNINHDQVTGKAMKGGNILIVDDMPENLFALKELLSEQCDQITCASSGNEALSLLLKENRYSLILLDVQMPGLDGFETLSLMKKHPKTCDIPVIFITAIHNDEKYLHVGYETGAVDYICKPIDPVLIRSKIAVFLEMQNNKEKLENKLDLSLSAQQSNSRILENSTEGIVSVDEFGFIIYTNKASEQMLGYSEGELLKTHIFSLLSPHLNYVGNWQLSSYSKAIERLSKFKENSIHVYKKDDSNLRVDASFSGYDDKGSHCGIFVFQDITERKKDEDALLHLATHDCLTQLPNRLLFTETLNNTISRVNRYEYDLYVMFIDLDHFKHVNDELGHTAGDSLLKDVAQRLLTTGRDVDIFARLGGDEFAVIFEDDNRSFDAHMVATKLLKSLKKPFYYNNQEMYISASIGVVKYPDYAGSAEDLLNAADTAMYKAKQSGRNKVEFFDVLSAQEVVHRSDLQFDLKQALHNQEIKCFFQPVCNAVGKVDSLEVLARWEHPILGVLRPSEFIELAEELGIITNISFQIFVSAFEQLQRWEAQGKDLAGVKLSFNLSQKQLFRKTIVDDLIRLRDDYQIDLNRLIVEIHESKLIDNTENILSTVNELKTLGVSVTIDGYGNSLSSLRLIANLQVDSLKLDKSLVASNEEVDHKIIESTLLFAKNMSIDVIAVGIESIEVFHVLQSLGIHLFQGHYFCKALDGVNIETHLGKIDGL